MTRKYSTQCWLKLLSWVEVVAWIKSIDSTAESGTIPARVECRHLSLCEAFCWDRVRILVVSHKGGVGENEFEAFHVIHRNSAHKCVCVCVCVIETSHTHFIYIESYIQYTHIISYCIYCIMLQHPT